MNGLIMDDKYVPTDAKIEFDGIDLSAHLTTVSTVLDAQLGWFIHLEGPDSEALNLLTPVSISGARRWAVVTIAGRRFEGPVLVKRRNEDHNVYTGDPWVWVELAGAPPEVTPPISQEV